MFNDKLVLELANVLAGPSVGMFFAELGARVIKVENLRTQGDVTRTWKLPHEDPATDLSAYFTSLNWGKSSLALDLKKAAGREIVYQLAEQADIVISSYLPGQAERLGVDAETLMAHNPALICGEINGYGPELLRPAYDAIIQAEAGFTYINGEEDRTYKMPVALMDVIAAHQLKEALLVAIIERMHTGQGKRVSVSLLQSGISALVNQAANWLVAGHMPEPIGSDHPNIVPYGTQFETADGKQIVLAVGSDVQFETLCGVLKLKTPQAFRTNQRRVVQKDAVKDYLQQAIQAWERDALLVALRQAKVPAGAVNNMQEVFEQELAQELLLGGPNLRGLRGFVGLTEKRELTEPPTLGADTDSVLEELGYSREQIQALRSENVV
jgi:crotonobetainyl-CoA:carnitine CoA-transferase CaiB-like acyl-CoA transferase